MQALDALLSRRQQLLQMRVMESNRLATWEGLRITAAGGRGTIAEPAINREADELELAIEQDRARLDAAERGVLYLDPEDIRYQLEDSAFIGRATKEGHVILKGREDLLDRD